MSQQKMTDMFQRNKTRLTLSLMILFEPL